jgi:1,4-alpha-glucan branching enzyme
MKSSKSSRFGESAGTVTITSRTGEVKEMTVGSAQSYGPRQASDGVMFTASYPQASSVKIAGDFNGWQPDKTPMTKTSGGTWQAKVSLAKGAYRYRLVVDGRWQHDPHNTSTEPNPYGELNSVFRVS